MDVLDEARNKLQEHGVEVELPETTEFHEKIDVESDGLWLLGLEASLKAASYEFLNDRMDVYSPIAINRAFLELDEDENEQALNAVKRNRSAFSRELNIINFSKENPSHPDEIKLSKIKYEAALRDSKVDEEVKEKLTDSVKREILHDSEHELVHASHYQSILEGDVDPLQEEFLRYFEDVRNLNSELSDFIKNEFNVCISGYMDLKISAALEFADEDNIKNIVSLAGREEKRWSRKHEEVSRKYSKRIQRVRQEFYDDIQDEAAEIFKDISGDMIQSLGSGLRIGGGTQFEDAEELVNILEEEGFDEYESMIDNGCRKSGLIGVLSTIRELKDLSKEESEEYQRNATDTIEHLEGAIIREAEIQGDFEGFLQQYVDRVARGAEMPNDFTEAYAQFWSGYRDGILEEDREKIFERLEGYEVDGLDDTMNDLLHMYDEAEGTQEERIRQVMSSQLNYLEDNYDLNPSK